MTTPEPKPPMDPIRPTEHEALDRAVEKHAERIERANRERPSLIAQASLIGVLGLLFVLPVIGGAYLGSWLDSLSAGYSIRWTLSSIFVGVVIGALNVYFSVRN